MPTKLTCPRGHAMLVREEDLGKRLRCPVCKMPLAPAERPEEKLPTAALVLDPPPVADPELLPDYTQGAGYPRVAPRPLDPAEELAQFQKRFTKGVRRKGLRLLRVGLTLDYIAFICLMTGSALYSTCRILAVLIGAGFIPFAMLGQLGSLVGLLLWLTGTVLCLWVPEGSARKWAIAQLVALLAAPVVIFLLVLMTGAAFESAFGGGGGGKAGPVFAAISLAYLFLAIGMIPWVLFVLFLKSLGVQLQVEEADTQANVLLGIGIGLPFGALTVAVVLVVIAVVAGSATTLLVFLFLWALAVAGIQVFWLLKHVELIGGLRDSIRA